MDPNANLAEQDRILYRAIGRRIPTMTVDESDRMTELREALQSWIRADGFHPDWQAHPHATRDFRRWTRNAR